MRNKDNKKIEVSTFDIINGASHVVGKGASNLSLVLVANEDLELEFNSLKEGSYITNSDEYNETKHAKRKKFFFKNVYFNTITRDLIL